MFNSTLENINVLKVEEKCFQMSSTRPQYNKNSLLWHSSKNSLRKLTIVHQKMKNSFLKSSSVPKVCKSCFSETKNVLKCF